jgi:hypothetical protein
MSKKKPSRRNHSDQPEVDLPTGTFWAEVSKPEVRKEIEKAGIIWGVDVRTRRPSLFFGMELLERGARTGLAEKTHLLRLPIDFATDDPECLVAACLVLKGSHCYGQGPGETDPIEAGLN